MLWPTHLAENGVARTHILALEHIFRALAITPEIAKQASGSSCEDDSVLSPQQREVFDVIYTVQPSLSGSTERLEEELIPTARWLTPSQRPELFALSISTMTLIPLLDFITPLLEHTHLPCGEVLPKGFKVVRYKLQNFWGGVGLATLLSGQVTIPCIIFIIPLPFFLVLFFIRAAWGDKSRRNLDFSVLWFTLRADIQQHPSCCLAVEDQENWKDENLNWNFISTIAHRVVHRKKCCNILTTSCRSLNCYPCPRPPGDQRFKSISTNYDVGFPRATKG